MQFSISITVDSLRSPELEKVMQSYSYEIKDELFEVLTGDQLKEKICKHVDIALQELSDGLYKTDVYSIVVINPDSFFGRDTNANRKLQH